VTPAAPIVAPPATTAPPVGFPETRDAGAISKNSDMLIAENDLQILYFRHHFPGAIYFMDRFEVDHFVESSGQF